MIYDRYKICFLVIIFKQFSITYGVDMLGKVRKFEDSTTSSLKVFEKNGLFSTPSPHGF